MINIKQIYYIFIYISLIYRNNKVLSNPNLTTGNGANNNNEQNLQPVNAAAPQAVPGAAVAQTLTTPAVNQAAVPVVTPGAVPGAPGQVVAPAAALPPGAGVAPGTVHVVHAPVAGQAAGAPATIPQAVPGAAVAQTLATPAVNQAAVPVVTPGAVPGAPGQVVAPAAALPPGAGVAPGTVHVVHAPVAGQAAGAPATIPQAVPGAAVAQTLATPAVNQAAVPVVTPGAVPGAPGQVVAPAAALPPGAGVAPGTVHVVHAPVAGQAAGAPATIPQAVPGAAVAQTLTTPAVNQAAVPVVTPGAVPGAPGQVVAPAAALPPSAEVAHAQTTQVDNQASRSIPLPEGVTENNLIIVNLDNHETTEEVEYKLDGLHKHTFIAKENLYIKEAIYFRTDSTGQKIQKTAWVPKKFYAKGFIFDIEIIPGVQDKPQLKVLYKEDLEQQTKESEESSKSQDMTQTITQPAESSEKLTTVKTEIEETNEQTKEKLEEKDTTDQDSLSALLSATSMDDLKQHIKPTEDNSKHKIQEDADGTQFMEFTISTDQTQSTQPTTKFTVQEVYAGPARAGQTIEYEDSDDEFEDTEVHKVVTELGVKVDTLEHRMNAAEDNIDMLKKLVNYQHNIMEFSNMLKKVGPSTPEFGHRQFESFKFKPATYKESKELDVTEHPSDIKLYTVDSTDVTKTVELETSKYTVKQVGETIQYEWESEVKCTWITFEGKTVWSHRDGEYPLGVEYYPEDDKVVVDFEEGIIMYVKKGDLNQPTETRTSVDIPLGHLDDSEDETTDDSVQSVQSPISETYASGYATTSITQVEDSKQLVAEATPATSEENELKQATHVKLEETEATPVAGDQNVNIPVSQAAQAPVVAQVVNQAAVPVVTPGAVPIASGTVVAGQAEGVTVPQEETTTVVVETVVTPVAENQPVSVPVSESAAAPVSTQVINQTATPVTTPIINQSANEAVAQGTVVADHTGALQASQVVVETVVTPVAENQPVSVPVSESAAAPVSTQVINQTATPVTTPIINQSANEAVAQGTVVADHTGALQASQVVVETVVTPVAENQPVSVPVSESAVAPVSTQVINQTATPVTTPIINQSANEAVAQGTVVADHTGALQASQVVVETVVTPSNQVASVPVAPTPVATPANQVSSVPVATPVAAQSANQPVATPAAHNETVAVAATPSEENYSV